MQGMARGRGSGRGLVRAEAIDRPGASASVDGINDDSLLSPFEQVQESKRRQSGIHDLNPRRYPLRKLTEDAARHSLIGERGVANAYDHSTGTGLSAQTSP